MQTTRERIIEQALDLFSVRGYHGVSVQEIAEAVGIKAPSLYKHFASKKEIFSAILAKGEERYRNHARQMNVNGKEAETDWTHYQDINEDQLVSMGLSLFRYFLHDAITAKTRRMIRLEKYSDKELADLYTAQYIDDPLSYQSALFWHLWPEKKDSANVMALQFYGPLYLLLELCDTNPERESESTRMVEEHIRQFSRLYTKE